MDLVKRPLWQRVTACVLAGAAAGGAWSFGMRGLSLSPLVIVAWGWAPNRPTAWATMGAYFAVATSALGVAVPRFLDVGLFGGVLLWLSCAGVLAAVWAALWDKRVRTHYEHALWRVLVALILTAVPPVGMIGLANPAFAAGAWFSGWGWVGLALFVCLVPWIQTGRGRMAIGAVAVFGAMLDPAPPSAPDGWTAVETEVAHSAELRDYGTQFDVATASMERAVELEGGVKIFPESSAGVWSQSMEQLWRPHVRSMRERGERRLLVGALAPQGAGSEYDSVALVLGPGGETDRYTQRIPVPFAMWRPWAEQTVRAHWLSPGTVALDGQRAGILICYEQGLLWTTLQSIMGNANVLVSLGNAFWFRGTDAEGMGKLSMRAVGVLFDIPVVSAFNR